MKFFEICLSKISRMKTLLKQIIQKKQHVNFFYILDFRHFLIPKPIVKVRVNKYFNMFNSEFVITNSLKNEALIF